MEDLIKTKAKKCRQVAGVRRSPRKNPTPQKIDKNQATNSEGENEETGSSPNASRDKKSGDENQSRGQKRKRNETDIKSEPKSVTVEPKRNPKVRKIIRASHIPLDSVPDSDTSAETQRRRKSKARKRSRAAAAAMDSVPDTDSDSPDESPMTAYQNRQREILNSEVSNDQKAKVRSRMNENFEVTTLEDGSRVTRRKKDLEWKTEHRPHTGAKLKNFPKGKTLGSPLKVKLPEPILGLFFTIVANLIILNFLFKKPSRVCR